jgi:hypothetical protein
MTMLSKALSLYTRLKTSRQVHSSLRTTSGGTGTRIKRNEHAAVHPTQQQVQRRYSPPLTTDSSWKML